MSKIAKTTWFAWYPVKLTNGNIAWLKPVNRQWDWNLNPWCDSTGWSGTDGGYSYQEIK